MRTMLCLALAVLFGGCSYWTARLRDFDDCFLASGHVGLIASVDARVGPFDTGLGFAVARGYGKPTWWRWDTGFPDVNVGLGVLHLYGDSFEGFISQRGRASIAFCTLLGVLLEADRAKREIAVGNGPHGAYSYDQWIVDQFAIEAGVFALVGVRAGINLAEVADFALGWFGIDLIRDLRDDDYSRPRPPNPDDERDPAETPGDEPRS